MIALANGCWTVKPFNVVASGESALESSLLTLTRAALCLTVFSSIVVRGSFLTSSASSFRVRFRVLTMIATKWEDGGLFYLANFANLAGRKIARSSQGALNSPSANLELLTRAIKLVHGSAHPTVLQYTHSIETTR
jgi:hypothetical protein